MITTVIFDIGNVLAAYDWEGSLKRLGYSDETREIIGNAVFRSADWNEMDRGCSDPGGTAPALHQTRTGI